MTRKDYQLIAATFQNVWDLQETTKANAPTVNLLIRALSISLAQDNPRFDANKFKEACGLKLI